MISELSSKTTLKKWSFTSSEGYYPAARVSTKSTAGLEGLNCKFKYVNAPPLRLLNWKNWSSRFLEKSGRVRRLLSS